MPSPTATNHRVLYEDLMRRLLLRAAKRLASAKGAPRRDERAAEAGAAS